jgi:tRNA uridine 5-carboxymethylaminomethyl modification enzyme
MFTSRAEHRLLLRIDNADLRLTPAGRAVGLVSDERWSEFEARRRRFDANLDRLHRTRVSMAGRSGWVPAAQALKQPSVRLADVLASGGLVLELDPWTRTLDLASVETTVKFAGYLKQEAARAARVRNDETRRIPAAFPFDRVPGLSREVVHRLTQVRPGTLGQASRIPGMTPAALAVLRAYLHRMIPPAAPDACEADPR